MKKRYRFRLEKLADSVRVSSLNYVRDDAIKQRKKHYGLVPEKS